VIHLKTRFCPVQLITHADQLYVPKASSIDRPRYFVVVVEQNQRFLYAENVVHLRLSDDA
jgi:hypothetical protein